jgi:hypothetical protein
MRLAMLMLSFVAALAALPHADAPIRYRTLDKMIRTFAGAATTTRMGTKPGNVVTDAARTRG